MPVNEEDRQLTEKVLKSIREDAGLSGYKINVTVRDGVVHLGGIVDVLAQKMRAEGIASGVDGVVAVENDLSVCTDGRITDDGVAFEVSEELRLDPNVDTGRIYAESKRGTVHLYGEANSPVAERAAVTAAARARGVKEVVSHVEAAGDEAPADPVPGVHGRNNDLAPAAPRREVPAPEQAAYELERTLAKHPSLAERVSVSLMDGRIVLRGEVADLEQKRAVEEIAGPIIERFGREIVGLDMHITVDTR
ncbi:MAG: BON domain-containing protein [Betaproteobacteria bacterium]